MNGYFSCSRIAKLSSDSEGLLLLDTTTLEDIRGYLHKPDAFPSCATCTPMMGFPTVPAGVQPDGRIQKLQRNAVTWLENAIAHSEAE